MLVPLTLLLLAAPPPAAPSTFESIVGRALTDGATLATVTDLADRIGPRLSGSDGAAEAVRWAVAEFQAAGVPVRTERVKVARWVRGEERGEVLPGPGRRGGPLVLTALGGSAPTPPGGVEAEVVEVTSLEALATAPVQGRIVYFHHRMSSWEGYNAAAELRSYGPAKAAARGAVATMVRSVATGSLRSPHTGAASFGSGDRSIPAVALATEDAEEIHRWLQAGPVRVRLQLGCRIEPDVDSANVVGEIRGRDKPQEVVLLGAHLDSWDLAVGAQDDGAGVAMVLETARLLARMRPGPRRSVRFVLFMNEENGGAGAHAYADAHAGELHVGALEVDAGAGRPLWVYFRGGEGAESLLAPLLRPLAALGVDPTPRRHTLFGQDLKALAQKRGLPTLHLWQDPAHYFDVHHSAADTLDKIDPVALAQSAAATAWLTWSLADAAGTLVPPPIEPPAPVR
ncbi:MAG TPA: M20/M25/M40 family metallo-hydrolase [Myxococcaceae bacterium]|nr:M20/M25/M40 family metallo-hydrolase [Myxococcaceae bacterium]